MKEIFHWRICFRRTSTWSVYMSARSVYAHPDRIISMIDLFLSKKKQSAVVYLTKN